MVLEAKFQMQVAQSIILHLTDSEVLFEMFKVFFVQQNSSKKR